MNDANWTTEKRTVFCVGKKCEHLEHDRDIPYGHIENIPLNCNACLQPTAFVVPIAKEYPTFRPGTRLNSLQKAVRALLREWKNGWIGEKGRLCRAAGITNPTTIRRMCASKEMPISVYNKLYMDRIVKEHDLVN